MKQGTKADRRRSEVRTKLGTKADRRQSATRTLKGTKADRRQSSLQHAPNYRKQKAEVDEHGGMTSAEAPKRWDFDEPQICAKCGVVDLLTGSEFLRKNLCHFCNGRDDKENKYISLTIDDVPECIR